MARKIPISGLPLLAYKLRTGGLPWLAERVRREWAMPTTAPGQTLYRIARALIGHARVPAHAAPDTLFAFYDLAVAPITFDFLWFLVGAEVARVQAGLAHIHVVIVPGREGGVRKEDSDYDRYLDAAARWNRVKTILVPACQFLPALTDVTVASSRAEADAWMGSPDRVYPARYEPALPRYPDSRGPLRAAREGAAIGVLRARPSDLDTIDRWLTAQGSQGKLVTITLRASGYLPGRNSNLTAWTGFARSLDPSQYALVVIPDTAQMQHGLPVELAGFAVYPEAALDVGIRMALYERAFVNLGINNGPMGLCWLNDRTRYMTFKILTDSSPQASVEYMRYLGFDIGASLPGSSPLQRWVWEDDDLAVIQREFASMVARIDMAERG